MEKTWSQQHLPSRKQTKYSIYGRVYFVSVDYDMTTARPTPTFFRETSNDRLPLELGSVRPQTLPKRVSDNPRHFMFRKSKKIGEIFGSKNQFFINLARFSWSWSQMDIKISFSVKFCFRYKYSEVCTTKNYENVAKTLWKCCENVVKTLWNPCENLVKTLW